MRFILFFISTLSFSVVKAQPDFGVYKHKAFPRIVAQFNFADGLGRPNVTDWVSVFGDPNTALLTGTDNRSGSSVTVSTVAIGDANWNDNGLGTSGGYVAEVDANGTWPADLGSGYFFNAQDSVPIVTNIQIGGLVIGATYSIEVLSNRPTVTDNRRTTIVCLDNETTEWCVVNSAPSTNSTTPLSPTFSGTINQVISAGTVATFVNKLPNPGAIINLAVSSSNTYTYSYINAIRITRTS